MTSRSFTAGNAAVTIAVVALCLVAVALILLTPPDSTVTYLVYRKF